jgi:hypothetical protein
MTILAYALFFIGGLLLGFGLGDWWATRQFERIANKVYRPYSDVEK